MTRLTKTDARDPNDPWPLALDPLLDVGRPGDRPAIHSSAIGESIVIGPRTAADSARSGTLQPNTADQVTVNAAGQPGPRPHGSGIDPQANSLGPSPYHIQSFDLVLPGRTTVTSLQVSISDAGAVVGFAGLAYNNRFAGGAAFTYQGGMATICPSTLTQQDMLNTILPTPLVDTSTRFADRVYGLTARGESQSGRFVVGNGWDGSLTAPDTSTAFGYLIHDRYLSDIIMPGRGNTNTVATAVNDQGQIVGTYLDAALAIHGFLYSDAHYTPIDVVNAVSTFPTGITDRGEIVGNYDVDVGGVMVFHNFIERDGQVRDFDVPGARQTVITGVNNLDQIVGGYVDTQGEHGFVATPICIKLA